jgi:rubrerythrin
VLGSLLLLGAGLALYGAVTLVVQAVAALALVGLLVLGVGGLLNLKWVCSVCRKPIADRSVLVCPSCHASFT